MVEILAFVSDNSTEKISLELNKHITQLSDEILTDSSIFYAEMIAKIIRKNIWNIQDCDECLELLLSRKNYINNIIDLVIQLLRILIIDEQIVPQQKMSLTIETLKSLLNSKSYSLLIKQSIELLIEELKEIQTNNPNSTSTDFQGNTNIN